MNHKTLAHSSPHNLGSKLENTAEIIEDTNLIETGLWKFCLAGICENPLQNLS